MSPVTESSQVVAYYRVSTDAQAVSGLGLDAQRAAVRLYASKNNLHIVAEHTDAGVSGAAPIEQRSGLLGAMKDIVTHRAGALLVAKLDRVSRQMLSTLTIEKSLKHHGARLVSTAGEGTESDDAAARFTRHIMGAVSELERDLISNRVKNALAQKKARGERLGRPPFSFVVNEDGELEATLQTGAVVQAVQMRKDGKKLREIAEELGWNINKAHRVTTSWKGKEAQLMVLWAAHEKNRAATLQAAIVEKKGFQWVG